ncbi:MAG: diguanylate cyclase [Alphaproteobacteria bacterium]
MNSIDVFSNSTYFELNLFALFIYFAATFYCGISNKYGKSLWFLFFGIAMEFVASWYGYGIAPYHKQGYFNFLVFIELILFLISLALMGTAALNILLEKTKSNNIVLAFSGFILISIAYFVFIMPNGTMVNNMRYVFPLVGFLFISVALYSKAKFGIGFKLAAIITSLVSLNIILEIANIESFISYRWYIGMALYLSLTIALLIIKADYITHKFKESNKKIENSRIQIETIIKSSPFPIIISKLSDDKILVANNNAIKLFGIQEHELERYKLKDFFIDMENRKKLNETLEHKGEVKDFEILVKTATGNTPFWLLTSANTIDYNHDIAVYLAFQDITSRKNREILLKNQATRDPLTSLFNRRYFEEEVKQRISKSIANDSYFAVFMLDVDRFKKVNDTYGHKVGDTVLIEIANTTVNALRNNDIIARYGGEEFVVFLNVADKEKARAVAERLRETIAGLKIPTDNEGEFISVTISIGIATSQVSKDMATLIKMADTALYKAKNNGRNRTEFFDTEMANKSHCSDTLHPLFEKEENQEISLLDGVEANHIISNNNSIENEDIYNFSSDKKED